MGYGQPEAQLAPACPWAAEQWMTVHCTPPPQSTFQDVDKLDVPTSLLLILQLARQRMLVDAS